MYKVIDKEKLIGLKLSKISDGSIPITNENEPLQLVTLKHKEGIHLKAHYHEPKKRITYKLQECLFVKKGLIKVNVYNKSGKFIESLVLKKGEIFFLVDGGYSIDLLKDSELIETKNGPFIEDKILLE